MSWQDCSSIISKLRKAGVIQSFFIQAPTKPVTNAVEGIGSAIIIADAKPQRTELNGVAGGGEGQREAMYCQNTKCHNKRRSSAWCLGYGVGV